MMEAPVPVVAIVWFRRDLRVDDNPALVAALHTAHVVVPVFLWAPEEEGDFQPGRCLRWWVSHTLVHFQAQLAALGSRLIIRRTDDSVAALAELVAQTGAQSLFFNHLYDPVSLVRDHEVKQRLGAQGVCVRSFNSDLLYEPWEVMDDDERPFTSFKAFWNRVLAMPYPPALPLPPPSFLPPVPSCLAGLSVDEVGFFQSAEESSASEALGLQWQPGHDGGVQRLEAFLNTRLKAYAADRAKVDRSSSSELSPWIHCGSISVHTIYYRVRQKQQEWLMGGEDRTDSCLDFLQQMGYREYSRYLSFHFPYIHERALLAHLRAVPWRMDQRGFKAWKMGMTGYPLVDAGMKQLWSTGWLHNRLRVVCGTFLVKYLLLPWQWGLKHYWDTFLDADMENDALGWQYVAGCMADAHPFGEMMDIDKEALSFDPDGEYVRRWLPVLSRLPTQYIHAPFKAPPELLEAADVELGFNYPLPIISLEECQQHMAAAVLAIRMCDGTDANAEPQPFRAATQPAAEVVEAVRRLRESQTANGRAPPMPQGLMNGGHHLPAEQQRRRQHAEHYRRQRRDHQRAEQAAAQAAAGPCPDGHSSASEGGWDEEQEEQGQQHRHKRRRTCEHGSPRSGHEEQQEQAIQQQQVQHEHQAQQQGQRHQRRHAHRHRARHARHEGGADPDMESSEVVSNVPAASLITDASPLWRGADAVRGQAAAGGVHQVPSISGMNGANAAATTPNLLPPEASEQCKVPSASCPNPGSLAAQASAPTAGPETQGTEGGPGSMSGAAVGDNATGHTAVGGHAPSAPTAGQQGAAAEAQAEEDVGQTSMLPALP